MARKKCFARSPADSDIVWEAEAYDVVVVGGGHAGCEAALAASASGSRTLLLTLNIDRVAWQPCNPAVGGPAKSTVSPLFSCLFL